jgi:hypothetical protein
LAPALKGKGGPDASEESQNAKRETQNEKLGITCGHFDFCILRFAFCINGAGEEPAPQLQAPPHATLYSSVTPLASAAEDDLT